MHTKFCLENLKGRDHFEDLGVNGKILLEWILRSDWMHPVQDRDYRRAFVNTVINLRVQ